MWRVGVIILNIGRVFAYIIWIPFVVVMAACFAYLAATVLVGSVFLVLVVFSALLLAEVNFVMIFIALFEHSIWAIMEGMWIWLWGWCVKAGLVLWTHITRSFPPYFLTGIVVLGLYHTIEYLNECVENMKLRVAS